MTEPARRAATKPPTDHHEVAATAFSVEHVAERLKVTPLTVRRWLRSGALAGVDCDSRADCRISETAITTFLDARHRGGVQDRPRRNPMPS